MEREGCAIEFAGGAAVIGRVNTAWKFWRRSQAALDELQAFMQSYAMLVSAEPPLQVPQHDVKQIKRSLAQFQESFTLMVRAQQQKVGR